MVICPVWAWTLLAVSEVSEPQQHDEHSLKPQTMSQWHLNRRYRKGQNNINDDDNNNDENNNSNEQQQPEEGKKQQTCMYARTSKLG
jgi:hypothetical protein